MYTNVPQRLAKAGLPVGGVIAYFHWWRVLPLMDRRLALDEMVSGAEPGGTQMAEKALVIQRAKRAVDKLSEEPFAVVMRPEARYLQFVSVLFRPLLSCRFNFVVSFHNLCGVQGLSRQGYD